MAARKAHGPHNSASITMPMAETTHPAMTTGRRPRVSATRPPGSNAAPFSAANKRNPIPVQTADRCRISRTNSGTRAPRTPSAAKPSARLADAAARQVLLRTARTSVASGPADACRAGRPRSGTRRSTTAARIAGTTSRPP